MYFTKVKSQCDPRDAILLGETDEIYVDHSDIDMDQNPKFVISAIHEPGSYQVCLRQTGVGTDYPLPEILTVSPSQASNYVWLSTGKY